MELPLPADCEYLPKNGLPLASIAKLLPFAFYSLEDDSSLVNIPNVTTFDNYDSSDEEERRHDDDDDDGEMALEQQLIQN
eukprot:10921519-Ditylum_brightwellii.AAC.1